MSDIPEDKANSSNMHSTSTAESRDNEAMDIVTSYSAKTIAIRAQKARVSRRLLLANRSQKFTLVCTETGIVSLLEIPAIPGFAGEYIHPLSLLSNARGLAQRGKEYLRRLDTQVLAGILLTIAGEYELFKFRPFDSGAEKNAILRTAGKDVLIDAIILIENYVHSNNCQFLPHLSLVIESFQENIGIDGRIIAYLKHLSESIAKPDKERYNSNEVKKIGRPVYIKDVEKQEKKVSYLARQELARAKKEWDADKKTAKKLINDLLSDSKINNAGRSFLLQIFTDNALLTLQNEERAMMCMKLSVKEHEAAESLIELIKKDRKILTMELSEIEETFQETEEKTFSEDWKEKTAPMEEKEQPAIIDLVPPPGLTKFQEILWKKKYEQSLRKKSVPVQENIPSMATYTPSTEKEKLGKD